MAERKGIVALAVHFTAGVAAGTLLLRLPASPYLLSTGLLIVLASLVAVPEPVVICFQISIFAESYTPASIRKRASSELWFAFKLVSLQSHIHPKRSISRCTRVVICFQISIFAESYTPVKCLKEFSKRLWFAFKLVSLQSHIHRKNLRSKCSSSCDLLSN